MCGIIGYIGPRAALPRLVDGLRRLEYRGYDSAGVALADGDALWVRKEVGRVDGLARKVTGGPEANIGIAHTRWATHGGVTVPNAHPHLDGTNRIAVVHNGIIENATALRNMLAEDGVELRSETDTEVLPHLIARAYTGDPVQAVREFVRVPVAIGETHVRSLRRVVRIFECRYASGHARVPACR